MENLTAAAILLNVCLQLKKVVGGKNGNRWQNLKDLIHATG